MKGELYYKEEYPKELRITIANQDEYEFLRFIFSDSPRAVLARYKVRELEEFGLSKEWRENYSHKAEDAEVGEPYCTAAIWDTLDENRL